MTWSVYPGVILRESYNFGGSILVLGGQGEHRRIKSYLYLQKILAKKS